MKYIINYFTEDLFPGKSANKIARIEMAKAFSELNEVKDVFFYILYRSFKKKETLDLIKKLFYGNKINFYLISIPFLFQGYYLKLYFLEKIRSFISKFLIINRYFILFVFKKNMENELNFIRGEQCLFACWMASFFKKIKYNFELHNYEFGLNKFSDFLYKSIMKKSEKIITISDYTKDQWVNYGIDKKKIIVFPSCANLKVINTLKIKKNNFKEKNRIDIKKKIICYIGKVQKYRGIEDTLYAANIHKDKIFLIIGGNKEEIIFYKDFINKNYINLNNVIFLGFKDHSETIKFIKISDILLASYSKKCSTVNHMSPIKLFEYMASKIPIIVSNLPRIRDIVSKDEVNFFEADNPDDLSNKINLVLNNYKLSLNKAFKAYQLAKNYSWKKRAKIIFEAIKS